MIVGVLSASSQNTKVNLFSPFAVFFQRAISKYEARSAPEEAVGREAERFFISAVSLPPFVKKSSSSPVVIFLKITALLSLLVPASFTCHTSFHASICGVPIPLIFDQFCWRGSTFGV